MTLKSSEVRVAGTGELYLGPVGTALPTDVSVALNASFKGYGYTTEDGVTLGKAVDREGIPAWQSLTPVRYLTTSQEFTIGCEFLQTNEDVVKLWLQSGDFAGTAPNVKADVPIDPISPQWALVLEWKDGVLITRLCVPKVEISEQGDVTIARAATSFPVTFAAVAPDSGSVLATWMTNDTNFAAV